MKLYSKLAIASAVVALAFVSTASAQSMRVSVPFGFRAGDQVLPAGDYRVDLNLTNQRVTWTNIAGRSSGFLMVKAFSDSRGSYPGSLIFNRYGENYFLARVNAFGVGRAADVFRGKAEHEMANRQISAKSIVIHASGL